MPPQPIALSACFESATQAFRRSHLKPSRSALALRARFRLSDDPASSHRALDELWACSQLSCSSEDRHPAYSESGVSTGRMLWSASSKVRYRPSGRSPRMQSFTTQWRPSASIKYAGSGFSRTQITTCSGWDASASCRPMRRPAFSHCAKCSRWRVAIRNRNSTTLGAATMALLFKDFALNSASLDA